MITEQSANKRGRPTTFQEGAFLRHACNLFWEHGYDAVAFDPLVLETKVTRRALYSRYKSKEALLRCVLTYYLEELFSELDSVEPAGRTPREVLVEMGRKLVAVATQNGGQGCLLLNTVVNGNPPDWARSVFWEAMKATEDLLARKQREAGASAGHSEQVGRLACIAFNGLTLRARGGDHPDALERDIQSLGQLFYPEN